MLNYDKEKNQGKRRMLEGQFKDLIKVVGELIKN